MTPEANSRSPSLEMMLRAHESLLRPARISDQIIAHRRARHRAAADADRIAIVNERGRLLERNDLFAQAAIALRDLARAVRDKVDLLDSPLACSLALDVS